jgi:hypothetical protein
VTASYLSDGPGDLLKAVSSLTRTAEVARASWEDEPGEYRWIFTRHAEDVRVRLVEFEDAMHENDDEHGAVLIDRSCTRRDLVEAVASAARQIRERHGEDGYSKAWGHPFPVSELALLEGWLGSN